MLKLTGLILCAISLLFGCSSTGQESQKISTTSQAFWQALSADHDYDKAARYTLSTPALVLRGSMLLYDNPTAELGTPSRLDETTWVIPTLLKDSNGEHPVFTIMTEFNGEYRVNYKAMMSSVAENIQQQLTNQLDDSGDWLDQKLSDMTSQAREELQGFLDQTRPE